MMYIKKEDTFTKEAALSLVTEIMAFLEILNEPAVNVKQYIQILDMYHALYLNKRKKRPLKVFFML